MGRIANPPYVPQVIEMIRLYHIYDRLQILDISDPLRPRPVGFYITTGTPAGVAVAGGYIYVADGDGGLVILQRQ